MIILRPNSITVEQVPDSFNMDQQRTFLCQLQDRMSVNRPYIVLDCSRLDQLDNPAIHLILACLEEAMKRNGDVRLAGVSPSARAGLASVGADRLFHFFASSEDAVSSFHQRTASVEIRRRQPENAGDVHEKAA